MGDFEVKQDSYPASPDGAQVPARANRRNELISPDYYQQWVEEGRVFITSNAAMETARDIGNAAYTNIEAAIALDVPTGTTIVPLDIELGQGGTQCDATQFTALFTLDDQVRITSGNAVTPRNLRINPTEPRMSKCTMKIHDESATALLIAANAEDNTFYGGMFVSDVDALEGGHPRWNAKKSLAPVIKGPGSLVIHLYGGTTDEPVVFWHVIWAEFDTDELWAP